MSNILKGLLFEEEQTAYGIYTKDSDKPLFKYYSIPEVKAAYASFTKRYPNREFIIKKISCDTTELGRPEFLESQQELNEGISEEDLANLLFDRLLRRFPDIITQHGHERVGDAILDAASHYAGAEELGSSDINIMLKSVLDSLEQELPESSIFKGINEISSRGHGSAFDRGRADAYYMRPHRPHKIVDNKYITDLTPEERKEYSIGYREGEEDDTKDYGRMDEDLRKWFKEKWVRFGPDGKIRGACARGSESEGKPKCLPQAKAHALGKKGRKYAASKKRREDPNPERRGPAKNVATKKKSNEGVAEGLTKQARAKKEAESVKAVIARLEQELKDPNPHTDKDDIRRRLETEKRRLELYRDVLDEQGVAEAELDEACWKGYHKEGNKKMFGKTYPNCVKNTNEEQGVAEAESLEDKIKELKDYIRKQERVLGGGNALSTQERKFLAQARKELKQLTSKNKKVMEESCPHCSGEMVSEELMNEKKDACYYKVKSRYKVWPSAYASGALVKCRKKGAKNWGTKSESAIMRGIQNEEQ